MNAIELLLKSTSLILVGALVCLLLRKQSSVSRYVVWVGTLTALLLIPIGMAIPRTVVKLPTIGVDAVSTVTRGSSSLPVSWMTVWGAISLLLLGRIAIAYLRGQAIARGSREAGAEQGFEVRIASGLHTPVAWGLGRKLMLIPEDASDWDKELRRIVAIHESCHLRRNDCWALLLSEIACALYWCNPFVWFAAAQLRREQEQAADDDVLLQGVSAPEYAEHLVALARANRTPMLAAGAVRQSDLSVRVKAILEPGRVRTMPNRRMLIFGVTALFAVTLPLATMQAQRKVYKLDEGGIIAPKLTHKQEPAYTQAARDAKIEGRVKIEAVIEVDGRIDEARVIDSLDEGLDANAIAA